MPQAEAPAAAPEGDDVADFGDEAAAGDATGTQAPPQRAMPDYGDVVDGDDEKETKPEKIAVKDEGASDAASAPKRLDAILITGVERLNRTHIAEIFETKKLPEFVRVDWISDAQVIAVYATDEEAATVLRSAIQGFRDVEDDGAPGPGLWRARRGMLDFRQATIADQPEMGFRRVHRAGKQVREFRLFTAMTDMDKQILEREEALAEQRKRPAPPRDDLDESGQPRAKKARTRRDDDREGSIDLLERMAHVDKRILVKQEERGELDDLPEMQRPEDEDEEYYRIGLQKMKENLKNGLQNLKANDDWDSWGNDRNWQQGGGRGRQQRGGRDWQSWGHDDREGGRSRSPRRSKGGKGGKKGRRDWDDRRNQKGGRGSKDSGSKQGRGKGDDAVGAVGAGVESTQEEIEKRARRNQRFQTGGASAEAKEES